MVGCVDVQKDLGFLQFQPSVKNMIQVLVEVVQAAPARQAHFMKSYMRGEIPETLGPQFTPCIEITSKNDRPLVTFGHFHNLFDLCVRMQRV